MKMLKRGFLYWNTVKNLKPVQIKYQVLNRIKGKERPLKYDAPQNIDKVHIVIPELDGDETYLNRFDVGVLMCGKVLLLHEIHNLHDAQDASERVWYVPEASHLWNYNLHYLEFLIPLAVEYHKTNNERYKKKYIEILDSWIEASYESKDAYESYTISMRLPNVLIGMELLGRLDESFEQKIYTSLYGQYQYLQQHQELSLLANHYFENLKTLVISSILFSEKERYHKYFSLFLGQIKEQILPDGLHYERSLMYHKIILEDILRVYTVLQSSGHRMDAEKLIPAIEKMAEALESLECEFSRTPLFNDAGDNISKPCASLLKVSKSIYGESGEKRTEFPETGYYRLDQGNCAVFFDCGDIGPKYMGGHAHNDCLSFELSLDGKTVFINSGTGQYQGDLRKFFRSTKAHNTVMIDDREQSELWGEHRAAKRISHIKSEISEQGITGQFQSSQGDFFRRKLQWSDSSLLLSDYIKSEDSERHIARQFFHIAPGYHFERDDNSVRVVDAQSSVQKAVAEIRFSENADFLIHSDGEITTYAQDFGKYEKKQVLEIRTPFEGSVRSDVEIEMKGKK